MKETIQIRTKIYEIESKKQWKRLMKLKADTLKREAKLINLYPDS